MTDRPDDIERVRQVYSTVYRPDPADRSYPWHPRNPISIYYRQAQERALITLFDDYDLSLEQARVLDVGCGGGGFLRFLLSLQAQPGNLQGLDLMPERIELARAMSPAALDLRAGDAETLPYPDGQFDLVSQFTVFSSIFDPQVRGRIADEMVRVLKRGGHILWYDMRHAASATTRGIEVGEIRRLFARCTLRALRRLHPPYASRLARRSILLCELVDRIPGLRKTHYLALLRKD